ncbi:MAG: ABC transporter ATP-binding protein [Firmicutes bacterium]|nr:ABC transporter ATP-binding protein [Bacillota bacterium]
MIKVNQLCKSFGSIKAVDNVSIHVQQGEIFGLVGPDGAGKTTLIRMICDLITPDSGEVLLFNGGQNSFGYMPQKFSLYGDLTVMENINFFGAMYGMGSKTIRQRADEILELTNLINFKGRFADNLSGGMKQKLALTCALLSQPQLLVLDEPTFGVDPESRKEFWKTLYQLNQEKITILVSTPYMDEADLCHKVGFMNNGQLAVVDSPQNLKKRFPYQILEVKAETTEPEIFAGLENIIDVSFYGNKYHLVTNDALQVESFVSSLLQDKEINTQSIKQVLPSMEDVFVYLAEKEVD